MKMDDRGLLIVMCMGLVINLYVAIDSDRWVVSQLALLVAVIAAGIVGSILWDHIDDRRGP